jgi:hypothetical protein
MEYMMNKTASEKKTEALNEVRVGQAKREMDAFLLERYPSLANDDSEMRVEVEQAKAKYGLTDHPYGDYFGVATRVMETLPDIIRQAYEKGKTDGMSHKADDKRREKISESDLTPSGKKKGDTTGDLTPSQKETAKALGFKPGSTAYKHYVSLVSAKSARGVYVED